MKISFLDFLKGDDLRRVNDFILDEAKKARGCLPPPMLNQYVVAESESEILACCGATLARDEALHLENIYAIEDQSLLSDRSAFCEIGRWISVDATAAIPVLRNMIDRLRDEGLNFAFCELKDATLRRTRMKPLELQFTPVAATLLMEQIDPTELPYYLEDAPKLYKLDLTSIEWK